MRRISSIDQIHNAIKRIRDLRKGYYTNLFLDSEKFNLWIDLEIFYYFSTENTEVFFKKNSSFYNVYYCSSSIESLHEVFDLIKKLYSNTIFVFDIIGQEAILKETIHVFNNFEFNLYTSLNRMSRLNSIEQHYEENHSIQFANENDLIDIKTLLYQYFDEYAEQIPQDIELVTWIEKKHLLLYVESKQIIGFVIFDINGITSYLRYWFVHPLHRNKKVGSSLLRRYFYESRKTKRQLFWVIENNENAIIRYQHYGFAKENLVDYVFININKQYENKNY